ncbi:MAG: DUF2336 domain-containing protein [Xanthobacteraceae bacterium]
MLAAQAPLIPELEEALRRISADKHGDTVRRVTDFFVAGASRFGELHVCLFDRILGRLIAALESPALVELARALAPLSNAPPDVIRRLAGDDAIAVAGPVLARSSCLDELDLIEIARTKSQAHLFAISGRAAVSEAVSDMLVDRGDRDVARNIAMNHRARFSETGIAKLAERAANDAVLAEKLGKRQDLPAQVLRVVLLSVPLEIRQRVLAFTAPEMRTRIDDGTINVPHDIDEAAADADAWRIVHALKREGRLDEAQVLEFARSGRNKELLAALALICDVSVDVVRGLITSDQPDAALILCQAAAFSWPTARAVLAAGSHTALSAALDKAEAEFDRLSPSTAGRIVGFWSACHGELRAAS